MQYPDKKKISEKENNGSYTDLYNQFARKEKQTKPMEKYGKRPDWNINKPGKRYIPASERYPRRLQKQREEKKVRRQIELLQLVERNTPGKLCQKKEVSPERSPSSHQETNTKSKGHAVTKVMIWCITAKIFHHNLGSLNISFESGLDHWCNSST